MPTEIGVQGGFSAVVEDDVETVRATLRDAPADVFVSFTIRATGGVEGSRVEVKPDAVTFLLERPDL
jgi:hypothetical protein